MFQKRSLNFFKKSAGEKEATPDAQQEDTQTANSVVREKSVDATKEKDGEATPTTKESKTAAGLFKRAATLLESSKPLVQPGMLLSPRNPVLYINLTLLLQAFLRART